MLQLTSYLGTMWALNWFPYPFEVSTVSAAADVGGPGAQEPVLRVLRQALQAPPAPQQEGAGTLPSSSAST